jgi:hypothetical protein
MMTMTTMMIVVLLMMMVNMDKMWWGQGLAASIVVTLRDCAIHTSLENKEREKYLGQFAFSTVICVHRLGDKECPIRT